jgi:hypothetical protein
MPGYRPLPSRNSGPLADSVRSAEQSQRDGDPAGAIVLLEEALAASLRLRPEVPGWLCGRLAALYRTLGRIDDEVYLLERYGASQTQDDARTRYDARLSKARAIAERRRPKDNGALASIRQTLDRPRRRKRFADTPAENVVEHIGRVDDGRPTALDELFAATSNDIFHATLDDVIADACTSARHAGTTVEEVVSDLRAASVATIVAVSEDVARERYSRALVTLLAAYYGDGWVKPDAIVLPHEQRNM